MSHCTLTRKRIVVLGSTGSIGVNTLDVVRTLSDRFQVLGLSAHSNADLLLQQLQEYRPRWCTVTDPKTKERLRSEDLGGTLLLAGEVGVETMVAHPEVDIVVVAIVGAAGLHGTCAALKAGKTVAFANKETLVLGGRLVMELARASGARLLPVDSEHSAVFQLLQGSQREEVVRVVLTGSGGPFRGKSRQELAQVTVEQALKHPTWKMGPKITIDSATLMNKALEVIEARWLFDLAPEQIEVIIHPQSIVHSFVEYRDGSVLAQLSPPDMRLPIQYALLYPERSSGPAKKLDWRSLSALQFEKPDREAFPALELGYEVARRGGTAGAVLNAANEAAVARFLNGSLAFLDIPWVCRQVLDAHTFDAHPTLPQLLAADRWARQEVARWQTG